MLRREHLTLLILECSAFSVTLFGAFLMASVVRYKNREVCNFLKEIIFFSLIHKITLNDVPKVMISPLDRPLEVPVRDLDRVQERVERVGQGLLDAGQTDLNGNVG